MRHVTIDYGIDLGTTNSSICRMQAGKPVIIRGDSGMDTMPSCISFHKGGTMRVGYGAYTDLSKDKLRALKRGKALDASSYIEFKRFMGSDTTFCNSFIDEVFTPEDLSARVIESLCSFVTDDDVKAAVITVPAKFTVNQKDATISAARKAGLQQIELLQEPIAASLAYGLKAEQKNGTWMVFDLGGGTLDVALINVSDGVMQVYDTEGDNYLGGKNLDEAIVAEILLPELARRFSLPLANRQWLALLVDALKVEAEKLKNKLSYTNEETVFLEAGDWGEDEDGEEIEMQLSVSRLRLEQVMRPVLQKAVDVCLTLMRRNGIAPSDLSHLILIGGPTYIPLLRTMLSQQVTPNVDTDIDPMTAVAAGAAIYASTIPIRTDCDDINDDTLQLDIDFESTTVDTLLFLPVKAKKHVDGLSVKLIRSSDGYTSTEVPVAPDGAIVEAPLLPGCPNTFRISARVGGIEVKCFPAEITVVQGTKAGSSILPYNIGIEVFNTRKGKSVFASLTGLEKNRPLPAKGSAYGMKTMTHLNPGVEKNILRIAIYQGDDSADGKSAVLFEHVSDVIVSGDDIVSYIPENSILNIYIDVDRSEMMTITAEFPESKQTVKKKLDTSVRQSAQTAEYLSDRIDKARLTLANMNIGYAERIDIETKLRRVRADLDNGSQMKQVEQHLKEIYRLIEDLGETSELNTCIAKLNRVYNSLVVIVAKSNDLNLKATADKYGEQIRRVTQYEDIQTAKNLYSEIDDLVYNLTIDEQYRSFLRWIDRDFAILKWRDRDSAQQLLIQAREILKNDPEAKVDKTRHVTLSLNDLLARDNKNTDEKYIPSDLPSM